MDARQAARGDQVKADRGLAAARGEQYGQVIEIGPHWDAGAPLPHLLSNGSRAFVACRAGQPGPDWDGIYVNVVSPADALSSLFAAAGCQYPPPGRQDRAAVPAPAVSTFSVATVSTASVIRHRLSKHRARCASCRRGYWNGTAPR
jgi:hypothetical protein